MLKEQRSRMKLERVCCYLARPAASEQRFALTKDDRVRYELKSNGTTCPNDLGQAFETCIQYRHH